MAAALPDYGNLRTQSACGAGFGLALKAHDATAAFAYDGDSVAAIEGYPVWSDPVLANIAARDGHASALIAAYRRTGAALLDGLRGSFSFALLDGAARRAICAIDRFGIQTLCYAEPSADLVVFGSTTDAVRAHPQIGATIAPQSIYDYLYFIDRVPAPETIYREQRKLAPGEALRIEPGRVATSTYWQMPYRSAAPIDRAAIIEELRRRLREALKANLEGEDQAAVGAFLSGGLDSSSVVGVAAGLMKQPLRTFTIGFAVAGFDEADFAEAAARHFGTRHQIYYLRPEDVVDMVPKAVRIYDEPFGNSSIIPAYHCARLAKEAGVEMMLAGDGGDELFAGNARYAKDRIFAHYGKIPAALRRGMLEPLARRLAPGRRFGPLGKVMRYVQHASKSVPERMASNLFEALSPAAILSSDLLSAIDLDLPRALGLEIFEAPRDATRVQRMMHFDLRVTLADSDLRKVCRMCELAGVRTRFPLLHDELAEFSARLPEDLLMEGGALRHFYKEAMKGFLPDKIINKTKHGFGMPYLDFMNSHGPLRTMVCDSLASLKKRGYFRAGYLDGLIDRARSGSLADQDSVAWDFVMLGLWLDSRA
jgi:asparagine synthase (glutamine-hydrolysing)